MRPRAPSTFFFSSSRRHTRYIGTGVQTCALPIFGTIRNVDPSAAATWTTSVYGPARAGGSRSGRSEERRVGEEGCAAGAPEHSQAIQSSTGRLPHRLIVLDYNAGTASRSGVRRVT